MSFNDFYLQLAEEVVTQGLSRDLEAFYNKTNSPRDQAKALELLTSIRLGQEIRDSQPRPYTAMPSLGGTLKTNTLYIMQTKLCFTDEVKLIRWRCVVTLKQGRGFETPSDQGIIILFLLPSWGCVKIGTMLFYIAPLIFLLFKTINFLLLL